MSTTQVANSVKKTATKKTAPAPATTATPAVAQTASPTVVPKKAGAKKTVDSTAAVATAPVAASAPAVVAASAPAVPVAKKTASKKTASPAAVAPVASAPAAAAPAATAPVADAAAAGAAAPAKKAKAPKKAKAVDAAAATAAPKAKAPKKAAASGVAPKTKAPKKAAATGAEAPKAKAPKKAKAVVAGAEAPKTKAPRKAKAAVAETDAQLIEEDGVVAEEGKRTRHFRLMIGEKAVGRFAGDKPKKAANKAFTSHVKYLEKSGLSTDGEIKFSIVECTRRSKSKKYHYIGERVKLETPTEILIKQKDKEGNVIGEKKISYRFNNRVKKDKEHPDVLVDNVDAAVATPAVAAAPVAAASA